MSGSSLPPIQLFKSSLGFFLLFRGHWNAAGANAIEHELNYNLSHYKCLHLNPSPLSSTTLRKSGRLHTKAPSAMQIIICHLSLIPSRRWSLIYGVKRFANSCFRCAASILVIWEIFSIASSSSDWDGHAASGEGWAGTWRKRLPTGLELKLVFIHADYPASGWGLILFICPQIVFTQNYG